MARESLLVYYDLEWSHNDIIQMGATCGEQEFSQAIRPGGKMDPFVRRKIKLDVRDGPTGKRQIFDMSRKMFLPTLDPKDAFVDFITWLEDIGKERDVILVSHGNADILVLDRNFARFDLQERLYRVVAQFVDFQDYIQVHFTDVSSKMALRELVKIFCKGQNFRLHCADEDARALQAVCRNLHHMRGVTPAEYSRNMSRMRRIALKSITIPKNCRQIRELAGRLNPGSNFVLLPNIHGVYNIFASSPLFSRIEPPENFQFEVAGHVILHSKERYLHREEYKERTRLELACYIGNAYFTQFHLVTGASKSPLSLHNPEQNSRLPLDPGTPVTAVVLVTATNHVKLQDINVQQGKKNIDITKLLADLHKLKRGEKMKTPTKFTNEPKTNVNKENDAEVETFGEFEMDQELLARREKQVETFKKTEDYQIYSSSVQKKMRTAKMPRTPERKRRFSRRQWDGAVKQWKLKVHAESRRVTEAKARSEQVQEGEEVQEEKEPCEEKEPTDTENIVTI